MEHQSLILNYPLLFLHVDVYHHVNHHVISLVASRSIKQYVFHNNDTPWCLSFMMRLSSRCSNKKTGPTLNCSLGVTTRFIEWWRLFQAHPSPSSWKPSVAEVLELRNQLRYVVERDLATTVVKPKLWISACLAGRPVQYHGRHLHNHTLIRKGGGSGRTRSTMKASDLLVSFLKDCLGSHLGIVEVWSLCPEVDLMDLSVPRNPLKKMTRVEGSNDGVQSESRDWVLRDAVTGEDMTSRLINSPKKIKDDALLQRIDTFTSVADIQQYNSSNKVSLSAMNGFLLKSRSPTCGAGDARMYAGNHDDTRLDCWKASHGAFVSAFLSTSTTSAPLITERLGGKQLPPLAHSDKTMVRDGVNDARLCTNTEQFLERFVTHFLSHQNPQ